MAGNRAFGPAGALQTEWVACPSRFFAKGGSRECLVEPSGFDDCTQQNLNSIRSIATHPCKKRKDGAPTVGMVHAKIVKDGPPAGLYLNRNQPKVSSAG
jgi:hypothetical protein